MDEPLVCRLQEATSLSFVGVLGDGEHYHVLTQGEGIEVIEHTSPILPRWRVYRLPPDVSYGSQHSAHKRPDLCVIPAWTASARSPDLVKRTLQGGQASTQAHPVLFLASARALRLEQFGGTS